MAKCLVDSWDTADPTGIQKVRLGKLSEAEVKAPNYLNSDESIIRGRTWRVPSFPKISIFTISKYKLGVVHREDAASEKKIIT